MIWRITWRGLLSHALRFVMTALAIVLGISFLVGSFVITDTIRSAFDDLFAQATKGTDEIVRYKAQIKNGDLGDVRPAIPESLVAQIEAVPGVRVAEGLIQVRNVQILDRKGKPAGSFAPQVGYTWVRDSALSPWRLASGRAPRTASEVVIDRGTAKDKQFHLGDRVNILTPRAKQYVVVGITRFGRVDRPLGTTAALFTAAEAQRIAGSVGKFDQIAVAADAGVTQAQLRARLRGAISDPQVEVLTGDQYRVEQQSNIRKQLGFINIALGIFAGVGLLVGAFIIFNTFTIIVAQRTRELALMRAVGASPGQVFRAVLGESTLVGVIASALGVGGGVGLAAGLRALLDALGVSLPGGSVVVQPRTVLLGLVVGLLVTELAAFFPARKAASTPPIAALRDVALEGEVDLARRIATGLAILAIGTVALLLGLFAVNSGTQEIWLVGLGALGIFGGVITAGPAIVRPFARALGAPLPRMRGLAGRLARDNTLRNPRRSARTAIALTVGVALVGFITIFGASAKKSIRHVFAGQLRADYLLTPGSGGFNLGFSPDVTAAVAKLPEVDAVSGLRLWEVRVRQLDGKFGGNDSIAALEPAVVGRVLEPGHLQGSLQRIDRGIAVSEKFAKHLHLQLGDPVTLTFGTEANPTTLPVEAIYEKTDLAGPMLVSIATFSRHVPIKADFLDVVLVKPGVTPAQMAAAVKPILSRYPTVKLEDRNKFIEDQAKQVDQVVAFIYVLLALSVIIALLGIANTLALSIYERTHEIGLLRAVGMSRRQVRTTVRWEAVLIAILGTVIGLGLGLFFGWAITASLRDKGFTEFDIAPVQLVIVVVVGGLAAVAAAVVPAWRAGRMDVLDAIHTE